MKIENDKKTKPEFPEWVTLLYNRLAAMYGWRWNADFKTEDSVDFWKRAVLMRVQQESITIDDIFGALLTCENKYQTNPPTLPEFINACKRHADINPEAACYEACEQLARRAFGEDKWTHPAIFWAAMEIGEFALRNSSWPTIKTRWTSALQKQLDNGVWASIPKAKPQLPSPDSSALPPDVVLDRLAKIKEVLKSKIV